MYTIAYFINKLSAVPASNWCQDQLVFNAFGVQQNCVMGLCASDDRTRGTNDESVALDRIIRAHTGIAAWEVNDGLEGSKRYGGTPKDRIINVLREAHAAATNRGELVLAGEFLSPVSI